MHYSHTWIHLCILNITIFIFQNNNKVIKTKWKYGNYVVTKKVTSKSLITNARMHSNVFMGNRIYLKCINVFSVAIDQFNVSLLNTRINLFKKKYLTDPTS